ncbi:MAG: hypothetical protein ACFFA6_10675 [Promethearchaeota archaeon]
MVKIKNFIWIFPVLGGILTIIALFFPAAYFKITNYPVWMVGYNDETGWLENAADLAFGIIIVLIIFAASIILVYTGIKSFKGEAAIKLWALLASVIIILSVIWIVAIEGNEAFSWRVFNPGFGIIAPFIGACIALGGTIIASVE